MARNCMLDGVVCPDHVQLYSIMLKYAYFLFKEIQGGNSVIFHVNATQAVWLAAYNTGNTQVDGRVDHRFSTFSGFLIHQ